MDRLHTMLRAIRPETKSGGDHLSVFREFISHLQQVQHKAPDSPARARPPSQPPRKRVRRPGKRS